MGGSCSRSNTGILLPVSTFLQQICIHLQPQISTPFLISFHFGIISVVLFGQNMSMISCIAALPPDGFPSVSFAAHDGELTSSSQEVQDGVEWHELLNSAPF